MFMEPSGREMDMHFVTYFNWESWFLILASNMFLWGSSQSSSPTEVVFWFLILGSDLRYIKMWLHGGGGYQEVGPWGDD